MCLAGIEQAGRLETDQDKHLVGIISDEKTRGQKSTHTRGIAKRVWVLREVLAVTSDSLLFGVGMLDGPLR